jgi:hypothetical protein
MNQSIQQLEQRRNELLSNLAALGDFRPGSVSAIVRRCGKPTCHCARPEAPGHGPNLRLTYKIGGKTVTESFPNEAARRKAQREIAEFRRWQQLSREFVDVNTKICQARSVEDTLSPQEKKRPKRSRRKSAEK